MQKITRRFAAGLAAASLSPAGVLMVFFSPESLPAAFSPSLPSEASAPSEALAASEGSASAPSDSDSESFLPVACSDAEDAAKTLRSAGSLAQALSDRAASADPMSGLRSFFTDI